MVYNHYDWEGWWMPKPIWGAQTPVEREREELLQLHNEGNVSYIVFGEEVGELGWLTGGVVHWSYIAK